MAKPPFRGSEPAALRTLLKVLRLEPREAAAILAVPERDVAMWLAGQALHPGGPAGHYEAAMRLIDAVQARAA